MAADDLKSVEKRVARLENAIKVADDGSLAIQAATRVVIKAAMIEIEGMVTVVMKGGMTVEVSGGGNLKLKGGGVADLQAGVVRLNGGSSPVAHVGSYVKGVPPMLYVDNGKASVLV